MTNLDSVCVLFLLRSAIVFLSCFAFFLTAAQSARASLIFSIESKTVGDLTKGNSLEVMLTNTGPVAVSIDSFAFEVNSASADIQFTSATVNTTLEPYIFGTQSYFGPEIDVSTGVTLAALDLYAVAGNGVSVGSGTTVGLGHLFFDSLSSTVETIAVSFSPYPSSSLSDQNGVDIPITTFTGGVITVIPEPASIVPAAVGLLFSSLALRQRKLK